MADEIEGLHCDNAAVMEGYTKEIEVHRKVPVIGREPILYLLVKPDTDLTGTFRAWDMDAQEFVLINGGGSIVKEEKTISGTVTETIIVRRQVSVTVPVGTSDDQISDALREAATAQLAIGPDSPWEVVHSGGINIEVDE